MSRGHRAGGVWAALQLCSISHDTSASLTRNVWLLPTPTASPSPPPPAGCLMAPPYSDTSSWSHCRACGVRTQPHRTALLRRQPHVPEFRLCSVQLTLNWGSHNPLLFDYPLECLPNSGKHLLTLIGLGRTHLRNSQMEETQGFPPHPGVSIPGSAPNPVV